MTIRKYKQLGSHPKTLRGLAFLMSAGGLAALLLPAPVFHPPACAEPNLRAQRRARPAGSFGKPVVLASLEDSSVNESSGLVASRRHPNLFWTHNDSGDGPFLYAFDRAGRRRGVWRVAGAEARDWEDIAAGPGPRRGQSYLYAGDIGDNLRRRDTITVYRVAEPHISPAAFSSTKKNPLATEAAEALRLKYPDGKHDAEALMVHPASGDLYVVTKTSVGAFGVYKTPAPLSASQVITLARVAELRLPSLFPGMVTGGDISPDGSRVVLCDYLNAYEFGPPANAKARFDDVWESPPTVIEVGVRRQGEAVCYRLDGKAILLTSEKFPTPLIEVMRR